MRKSIVLLFATLCLCVSVAFGQQVSIQGPVNNIQGGDSTRPMMRFDPAPNQTGNQAEWRSRQYAITTRVDFDGNLTFGNCTSFQQTAGWGLNILPCVRPTGSQVYLFGLNDGGGQTSGLMSGNGAAVKTYAFGILVNRPDSADATGDSNDAIAKWSYNNYGQNDTNFILRGLNTVVNNRSGGTLGHLVGGLISASSKSGSTSPQVRGLEVNVENFGTNADEHSGIDVTLKNEGAKATLEYGVRVRNLNNSLATAADAAYMIGTSAGLTNTGFTYALDMNGATLGTEFRFKNAQTMGFGTDGFKFLSPIRGTAAFAYGFKLDDGGGTGSGSMTGGAAQKTYAMAVTVNRPLASPASGDSNDAIFRGTYSNYAANDANFIMRGINTVVNNRDTGTLGILEGGLISSSNKSGTTTQTNRGLTVKSDNFGSTVAEMGGVDVEVQNEGAVATLEYGIRVRNTNNSLATALDFGVLLADSGANTGYASGFSTNGATVNCEFETKNGACIYSGAQTTRDTVRAEVGLGGAIGSIYMSSAGKQYVKVANADATADWERVTTSAAD